MSYSFAYLDEGAKRAIRRALLKAVAIPGHQVPFPSREMPLPYGWGTGGIQVTASLIGRQDVLKVIDQGADDTVNAVSIRQFFARTCPGLRTTTRTAEATLIQTRHRVPEIPLKPDQTIIYQVPIPEPLRWLEPRQILCRQMHAYGDYGAMHVRLYEDMARHGRLTSSYDYPAIAAGRMLMAPSPVPAWDLPRMSLSPALQLFGAGRERRVYALPPDTVLDPLRFADRPFDPPRPNGRCSLCGSTESWLAEMILNESGTRGHVCSDSDACQARRSGS